METFKKYLLHVGLIVLIFILLFISMEFLEDANNIKYFTHIDHILVTFILWTCIYLILKGITNKTKLSLLLVIIIELLFDIINYVVRISRGSGITVSDLSTVKTAYAVVGNIKISFELSFIIGLIIAIVTIVVFVFIRKKLVNERAMNFTRIIRILIGIIIPIVFVKAGIYNSYSLWDMTETYRFLGSPITIVRMFEDINVKPPEGYNKDEAEKILDTYDYIEVCADVDKENDNNDDLPNIIVIVNESFSDYYNLYKDGNSDPIEYFTLLSQSENVISGVMYSSEYGGRTANVEYEFLTQNSTRILPNGSYVFQQYITSPVKSSLVQRLNDLGYKTSGMHPWEHYAYSRNKIYPLFGFKTSKFKKDMTGLEENFNNEFISDRSAYKELLKNIKQKKKGEKIFEYFLTVQNHLAFVNSDPNQIKYNDEDEKNVYMQLLHESSMAFKEIIDEVKSLDEKYIILFFGDHQTHLRDYPETDNFTDKYQTPFIIWANYDIEEEYNVKTSTIYLQNYLLKAASIKFDSYNNYLEELKQYYPVIARTYYMDSDYNVYINNENDDTSENIEKLNEYNKIDYYRIFDSN